MTDQILSLKAAKMKIHVVKIANDTEQAEKAHIKPPYLVLGSLPSKYLEFAV